MQPHHQSNQKDMQADGGQHRIANSLLRRTRMNQHFPWIIRRSMCVEPRFAERTAYSSHPLFHNRSSAKDGPPSFSPAQFFRMGHPSVLLFLIVLFRLALLAAEQPEANFSY